MQPSLRATGLDHQNSPVQLCGSVNRSELDGIPSEVIPESGLGLNCKAFLTHVLGRDHRLGLQQWPLSELTLVNTDTCGRSRSCSEGTLTPKAS